MIRIASLSLLLLAASCAAQPAAESAAPAFNPALFAVRDADSTMYLYGTMHLRRAGAEWGGANAAAALDAADEVWTELEIGADPPAASVQALGASPVPLSTRLSAAQARTLDSAVAAVGLAPGALERMQPWLAGLTLTIAPMLRAGYDPNAGVDRQIDLAAEAAGKNMRWFETAEEQLSYLAGLEERVQIEMLMDAAESAKEGVAEMEALEAAWASGDLARMNDDMIEAMRADFPELYDAILVRRNGAWMEVLTAEMAGAGVDFVAVGAAHLIGEDGLVAQFRARGYAVERVASH